MKRHRVLERMDWLWHLLRQAHLQRLRRSAIRRPAREPLSCAELAKSIRCFLNSRRELLQVTDRHEKFADYRRSIQLDRLHNSGAGLVERPLESAMAKESFEEFAEKAIRRFPDALTRLMRVADEVRQSLEQEPPQPATRQRSSCTGQNPNRLGEP
jgi:hypothetical protein